MVLLAGTLRPPMGVKPPGYWANRWGLVEHWRLDEASGSALASLSAANTLAASAAPTTNPGIVSATARQYTSASSQFHSVADNAALSGANVDWWVAAWCYLDSLAADKTVVSKYETTGNQREFRLGYSNGLNQFFFSVSADGITDTIVSNAAAPATGQWFFLFACQSAVDTSVAISVNANAFGGGALAGGAFNGTAPFYVGAQGAAGAALFMSGRIQAVSYGKSPPLGITKLRSEICNRLYNGGRGRLHPWT